MTDLLGFLPPDPSDNPLVEMGTLASLEESSVFPTAGGLAKLDAGLQQMEMLGAGWFGQAPRLGDFPFYLLAHAVGSGFTPDDERVLFSDLSAHGDGGFPIEGEQFFGGSRATDPSGLVFGSLSDAPRHDVFPFPGLVSVPASGLMGDDAVIVDDGAGDADAQPTAEAEKSAPRRADARAAADWNDPVKGAERCGHDASSDFSLSDDDDFVFKHRSFERLIGLTLRVAKV